MDSNAELMRRHQTDGNVYLEILLVVAQLHKQGYIYYVVWCTTIFVQNESDGSI